MTEQEKSAENQRDSELIKKIRKGDTNAFTKLLNVHKSALLKLNRSRLRNDEDAEDALQEESIIIYNSLKKGKYRENSSFGGWLLKVASNCLNDILRKRKHREELRDELPDVIGEVIEEDNPLEEKLELLEKARNELPERDREFIDLRMEKEKPWEEIGTIFKMDANSASGHFSRIKKKLEKLMKKNIF